MNKRADNTDLLLPYVLIIAGMRTSCEDTVGSQCNRSMRAHSQIAHRSVSETFVHSENNLEQNLWLSSIRITSHIAITCHL